MAAERFVIHSRSRERRKKGQHRQHVVVAALLIFDGVASLTDPHAHHGLAVPILIVAAGLLLLAAMGYEKWHHHKHGRHDHHVASWVEMAGALIAFAEAVHRMQGRHHALFYVLNLLAPLMIAALAATEIRGKADPYMQIDDEGFALRMRLLRPAKRIAWKDAKAFRVGPEFLEFVLQDGNVVKMKIADVTNRAEALQWAMERFEQRGLAAQ
jgi:protein-S-isoprenylcysteine O-methyltransferase Ste14